MVNIRQMMKYLPLDIAPTPNVQHFFVKYLFILENEVRLFQIQLKYFTFTYCTYT
jgi:hypothetical protein